MSVVFGVLNANANVTCILMMSACVMGVSCVLDLEERRTGGSWSIDEWSCKIAGVDCVVLFLLREVSIPIDRIYLTMK
jgi:hypothetical protein